MADAPGPRNLRQLLDAVQAVVSDLDLPGMLRRITQSAVELADARFGALGVFDESRTQLCEFVTVGIDDGGRAAIGRARDVLGLRRLLVVEDHPLRLADLADLETHPQHVGAPTEQTPMGSFLGLAVRVRQSVVGVLYLTDKQSAAEFDDVDEELLIGLAAAAGVAIENACLSARVRDLALLEDRDRIARDLHDTVIQRLFSTGMSLQGTARLMRTDAGAAAERIERAVDDLDDTVKDIRAAIFGLGHETAAATGLRLAVMATVRAARDVLGAEPRASLTGPIDTLVPADVAGAVVATLREALSNVGRHAQATRVVVELTVGSDVLLRVIDDGLGPSSARTVSGHGLSNMAERAEQLDGSFALESGDPVGTVLVWRVPLPSPA